MEHDSPSLLVRLACAHLITARMVRAGPVKLLERVASARARAERETYDRVAHLLTASWRGELDALLVVDPEIGMPRLRWLSAGPTEASAAAVKTEFRKLEFLRSLHARTVDLLSVPAERRRHLAAVGRRSSVLALTRRDPPPLPDVGGEMCVQLAEVRQERLGPEAQRAHLQPAREH